MRIIAKNSDYYDPIMRMGMDMETVYVRETKNVELDRKYQLEYLASKSSSSTHISYRVHFGLLGYCGYIFKIYIVDESLRSALPPSSRRIFYKYEEFKAYMFERGLGSKYDFSTSRWWPGTYQKFDEQDTKALVSLFHEYNTPLFLISSENRDGKKQQITLGPILKDLEFQKQKDPYTAYQDIFGYVAGHLTRPENTMVKISDKDKIHKHGFDKWSFRKMPTKKK